MSSKKTRKIAKYVVREIIHSGYLSEAIRKEVRGSRQVVEDDEPRPARPRSEKRVAVNIQPDSSYVVVQPKGVAPNVMDPSASSVSPSSASPLPASLSPPVAPTRKVGDASQSTVKRRERKVVVTQPQPITTTIPTKTPTTSLARLKELTPTTTPTPIIKLNVKEVSSDQDLLFYVCMPTVECVVHADDGDRYIVHSVLSSQSKLICMKDGKVESSMALGHPPHRVIQVGPTRIAIVRRNYEDRGVSVMYTNLPFDGQVEMGVSYKDVKCVSRSANWTLTNSSVYLSDVDSGMIRLLETKTPWPAGKLIADSAHSVYLCTHARLLRFSRAKNDGLPVWEHMLHSPEVSHLVADEDTCVYINKKKIIHLGLDGEARHLSLAHEVKDVAVYSGKIYVTTSEGILHVINVKLNLVEKRVLLVDHPLSSRLYLDGSDLYYTTSSSVHRISL